MNLKRLRSISLTLVMAYGLLYQQALAQYLPATRFLSAPLVSPQDGQTYYGGATTHTFAQALDYRQPANADKRPVEIRELARGLGASQVSAGQISQAVYAQRTYEYVRQNIETEFMFGLHKGALGALIDQSGTSFDQAQLLVELLREGGIAATSLRFGTITLTSTQFTAWTGVSGASVACRLLADGGIPAIVNGSSDPGCSMSGAITSISMSHVWVAALGNVYDPSYKTYATKPSSTALNALLSCGSSGDTPCADSVYTQAMTGATSANWSGAPAGSPVFYVKNLNQSAADSQLTLFAQSLQEQLRTQTQYQNAEISDILGGREIQHDTIVPPSAQLPYGAEPSYVAWPNDVPDQYRTRLQVIFDQINTTLFVDEFYGYRLRLFGDTIPNGSSTTRVASLYLEYKILQSSTNANATSANDTLVISVNHPYAAVAPGGSQAGSYMDESFTQNSYIHLLGGPGLPSNWASFSPTTILYGFGHAGPASASRLTQILRGETYAINLIDAGNPAHYLTSADSCARRHDRLPPAQPGSFEVTLKVPGGTVSIGPECPRPEQISQAAAWLSQAARVAEIIGEINNVTIHPHHSIGIISSSGNFAGAMSAESSFSLIPNDGSAASREAAAFSLAQLLSRLEASVGEAATDSFDGMSAVSLLARANETGLRTIQVNAANYNWVANNVSGYKNTYPASVKALVQQYAQIGTVLIPENYTIPIYQSPGLQGVNWPFTYAGYFAYRTPGTSAPSIARISLVTADGFKGGGSVHSSTPTEEALASTKFVDASMKPLKYFGVDTASGDLRLTPPPDLITGTGPFPQSLAFQRTYSSAGASLPERTTFSVTNPANGVTSTVLAYTAGLGTQIGGGWRHNYQITATVGSNPFQAMGEDSAMDAVETIVVAHVLRQFHGSAASQTFQRMAVSNLIAHWWGSRLRNNSVIIEDADGTETFMRMPDGTYNPGPHSSRRLSQTAAADPFYFSNGVVGGWDYSTIEYSLIGNDGSILTFDTTDYTSIVPPVGAKSNEHTFKARDWTFPSGIRVNFAYTAFQPASEYISSKYRYCLSGISNNLGRALNLTIYEGAGGLYDSCALGSVQDESGRSVSYTGTASGPDTTSFEVHHPTGGVTSYVYSNTTQQPTSPRIGSAITAVYSPGDSSTPFMQFAYDSLFRVTQSIRGGTQTVDYSVGSIFNERLRRGESRDTLGRVTEEYFDQHSQRIQLRDAGGRCTSSRYDSRQRLVATYNADNYNSNCVFQVDSGGDPIGSSTRYSYDARHNVIETRRCAKGGCNAATDLVETASYDTTCTYPVKCNKPNSEADILGRTTNYVWDNTTGLPISITQPAVGGVNPVMTFGYSSYTGTGSTTFKLLTLRTEKVDSNSANNRQITFAYNTSNKFVLQSAIADPSGLALTTAFTFDSIGNVQSINGPRTDVMDVTNYQFDAMRRLKRVDAPLGALTKYTYDLDGQLTKTERARVTNPSDANPAHWQTETREYYPTGDLKKITDAESHAMEYKYDAVGRQTLMIDPDGRRTGTVYFPTGEVACVWKGWNSATAPTNCSWNPGSYTGSGPVRYAEYAYTPNGRQDWIKDARNNLTDYTYDGFDRLRRSTFPDNTYEELWYTTNGELSGTKCGGNDQVCRKRTRANQAIVFTYDALDRPATKAPAGSPTVTFTYNLLGEPLSLTDTASHSISYSYDKVGRKATESTGSRQVSYQYDSAGNRTRTIWPDAYYVSYEYDALNRIAYARENGSTELARYQFDPLSQRTQLRFAGSETNQISYAYELDSNLDVLTHTMNTVSVGLDHGHNDSGQLTSISTDDDFYLPQAPAGGSTAYTANNLNQYATVGGNTLSYDPNGNLTSWSAPSGTQSYTYDAENRLLTATAPGKTISYDYDPLGRRLTKTVNEVSTSYLLDGDEEIAEYSGSTLLRRYIAGPSIDDRIARAEGSSTSAPPKTYYHTNHQGSVIAVTTTNGSIDGGGTQRFGYDPYGNLTGPATGEPFRYTGRRYDEETGLYYYRARYYSSALGRFLQTDPIGYEDDSNLYTYTRNDPVNLTDPNGKCPQCWGAGIGAAAGYVVSVGKQVIYDKKRVGDALTSREARGAAAAGAIVGLAITSGQVHLASTSFTTLETMIAQTGLAGASAVPATLTSAAVEGRPLPSSEEFIANAAGNSAGFGIGSTVSALYSPLVKEVAGAMVFSSERIAAGTVTTTIAIGKGLQELASSATSQSTTLAIDETSADTGVTCMTEPTSCITK